jgi:hypothetical protein
MMKAKIYKDLLSYQLVRRASWLLKVSVFSDKYVMILAQHVFDADKIVIRQFSDFREASDWVEWLVEQESI